ncbi:MAG: c-type cytochrome [Sandaracinaceae bacterium]|nr:c-type cytochrome [Sandaracinaceae bacterium]
MRYVQHVGWLCLPLALAGCPLPTDSLSSQPGTFSFNSGPLVSSGARPVPITGGTLLVSRDHRLVVAADPERDTVSVVDLASNTLRATIALSEGAEPGRLAEDHNGVVYVATRRGGELVAIDLNADAPSILSRVKVCSAPRGVTYDAYQDALHVACAGGELVTVDRASTQIVRSVNVSVGDLRDVIVATEGQAPGVARGDLLVSQFRSARLLTVSPDGHVKNGAAPADDLCTNPDVAWRTVQMGTHGAIAMLHQRARSQDAPPVSTAPGGYAGGGTVSGCSTSQGIVKTAISTFNASGGLENSGPGIENAMLAVDVSFTNDGRSLALAIPGNIASPFAQVFVRDSSATVGRFGSMSPAEATQSDRDFATGGQAIAVAFSDAEHLVVQTREPSAIEIIDIRNQWSRRSVRLATDSLADTGQYVFHAGVSAGEACASCHPEGGDDGHVWNFSTLGNRRTPQIAGGVLGTEPFHWDGDMHDFRDLVTHVFSERMGAGAIPETHADALAHYVDRLETIPPSLPDDMSAVDRGHALFERADTQCATCHSGPMLTNNATVDVGTGGAFQVPSLVGLGNRAPLMHNGCVATIHERLTNPCAGGDRHGHTSQLTSAEIDDLTAFLKTL